MVARCQQAAAPEMRCHGAGGKGDCYAAGCARVAGTSEQVGDGGGFTEHYISINYSNRVSV